MKFLLIFSFFPLIFGVFQFNFLKKKSNSILPNYEDLTTAQISRAYGYPAESHIVKTVDGYLLHLDHILPIKNNQNKEKISIKKKPPIFFQHGVYGTSNSFIAAGPEKSLPYILANLGFDVWLGNARGNTFSRAHVNLSPDDNAFWNFTFHESAIYDLPAEIDYICNYTKQEKIVYIGFSMGTTQFFVMASLLPEYSDKVEVALLMGVFVYLDHMKGGFYVNALFSGPIKKTNELVFEGEFMPHRRYANFLARPFYKINDLQLLFFIAYVFFYTGEDYEGLDEVAFRRLLSHFPGGYSVKNNEHLGQILKSGKFRQYDYGPQKNILYYGSPTPPEYPVENITTPMYFYQGKNDIASTLKDVQKLAKRLSSLRNIRVFKYPKFNHLDYLIYKDVVQVVYKPLIKNMMNVLNK